MIIENGSSGYNPAENLIPAQDKQDSIFDDEQAMNNLAVIVYGKSQEMIEQLSDLVKTKISDQKVSSSSRFCMIVNSCAQQVLNEKGYPVEYLEHEREGTVAHAFLRVKSMPAILLDFQYKQFVPAKLRDKLPDYLVLPYASKDDVVEGLKRHSVMDEFHGRYLSELFWES